jgi:hypothetical protein
MPEISIERAIRDPRLLGAALGDLTTWATWLAVLKAAFALPLSDDERALFIAVAGGRNLGGPDMLSEGQRQIARRAATIAIACEKLEGEAAAGNEIDLVVYGMLTDRLGRCFHRLGLKRQAKDVTPTLASILNEHRMSDADAQ